MPAAADARRALHPDQYAFALEEVETGIGAVEAAFDIATAASTRERAAAAQDADRHRIKDSASAVSSIPTQSPAADNPLANALDVPDKRHTLARFAYHDRVAESARSMSSGRAGARCASRFRIRARHTIA